MKSEDNLIKAALAKDQEAFREIVDIYQAFVFAIIFNIIRDYQEAENIQAKSYQKIADEEGVSIRTVGSRLYRAKKHMRQYREEGG